MLNCLQVKNIFAPTPEVMEEELNQTLKELGLRVQTIQFISPLSEGFACSVLYWSQNIPAEMTYKLENLEEDVRAGKDEPVFIAVIHDYQRELVKDALVHLQFEYLSRSIDKEISAAEQDNYSALADLLELLQSRFENDNERLECNKTEGYNTQ